MRGKKEGPRERRGIDWRMVAQNAGMGVLVWLASLLVFYRLIPEVFFMPGVYVAIIAYFRSKQRTGAQALAEAAFAGSITVLILYLFLPLIVYLRPTPTS